MNGIDNLKGSSGGGGTTVIANPQGTPTEKLKSIQIGNTIYSVSGGAVSGGVYTRNQRLGGGTGDGGKHTVQS